MPQPIRPRKTKAWSVKKIVAVIAVGLLIVLVILGILFVLPFFGGFQGLKNSITPTVDPHSNKIVGKRRESEGFTNNTFAKFEKIPGLTYVATGTQDICYRGEANWKRVDNFSNKCTQRSTRFYGYDGEIIPAVKQIGNILDTNGWKGLGYDTTDEWLSNHGSNLAQTIYKLKYGADSYQLPAFNYSNGSNRFMEIKFDERKDGKIVGYANQLAGGYGTIYKQSSLQDEDKVFAQIAASYPYAINISIEYIYFKN